MLCSFVMGFLLSALHCLYLFTFVIVTLIDYVVVCSVGAEMEAAGRPSNESLWVWTRPGMSTSGPGLWWINITCQCCR